LLHNDSKEIKIAVSNMKRKESMAFKDKTSDDPDEDYDIEKDEGLFED
jgi:hypothetical protein